MEDRRWRMEEALPPFFAILNLPSSILSFFSVFSVPPW
jgi:hypothetical protein